MFPFSNIIIIILIPFCISFSIPRACSTATYNTFPFCNSSLTLDERITDLISRIHPSDIPGVLSARTSSALSYLGVPEYDWGTNCIHGVQSRCGKNCPTLFPMPSALGASWNSSLIQSIGSAISTELRALWLEGVGENRQSGKPHIGLDCWSPTINIQRDPRWGRNQEVFSEDVLLTSDFGIAYTKGIQEGPDSRYLKAAVTLKHFAAYSLENSSGTDRLHFNAQLSPFDLGDSYLPIFDRVIHESHARGVMCALNAVNGAPSCGSRQLGAILRDAWKFDGYVTSDTDAIREIMTTHKYVDTIEKAVASAVQASVDINSGSAFQEGLSGALEQGLVTEQQVEKALRRTFQVRFELGLFDPIEDQEYWNISADQVNSEDHQALNLQSALQSIILLRNDENILPLSSNLSVALIGPHIDSTDGTLGNYLGQVCHGYKNYSCVPTPRFMFEKHFHGLLYTAKGTGISTCTEDEILEAVQIAAQADTVVLMLGLDLTQEGETHDRISISLPDCQIQLFERLKSLDKPTVITLFHGGTVSLGSILEYSPLALLDASYPGFKGSEAIAMTLMGLHNPSGKRSTTVYPPQYQDEMPMGIMQMDRYPGRGYRYYQGDAEFEFGFGLSYTSFKFYFNQVPANIVDRVVEIDITLTNIGDMPGSEVIQVYMKPAFKSKLRKQLIAYKKEFLTEKESKKLSFRIFIEELALTNEQGDKVVYPGDYLIIISNGLQKLTHTITFEGGPILVKRFPLASS